MSNHYANIVIPNNKVKAVVARFAVFNNKNLRTSRNSFHPFSDGLLRGRSFFVDRLLYKLNSAKTTQNPMATEGEFYNPFEKSVSNVQPDNSRPAWRKLKIKRPRYIGVIVRLEYLRSILNISNFRTF